jgi:AbrB family transcriptional regulator, transcriptional pleiotropic regulator of transition state genes
MKATGIVRKADDLGRVVIPIELRKTLNISTGDSLEIFSEEGRLVLQKYQPGCAITGTMENLVEIGGVKYNKEALKEAVAAL